MTRITKFCDTLAAAVRQQRRLYARYDHVRLIAAPRFQEAGQYIWEVR